MIFFFQKHDTPLNRNNSLDLTVYHYYSVTQLELQFQSSSVTGSSWRQQEVAKWTSNSWTHHRAGVSITWHMVPGSWFLMKLIVVDYLGFLCVNPCTDGSGLPREWAAVVLELKNLPSPKSPSFTTPVAVINTLAGLISARKERKRKERGKKEKKRKESQYFRTKTSSFFFFSQ